MERTEKKNGKQQLSANRKISICHDIFPFVFDILPFAGIIDADIHS